MRVDVPSALCRHLVTRSRSQPSVVLHVVRLVRVEWVDSVPTAVERQSRCSVPLP